MLEASASYGFRNSISLVFLQRKRLRCICVARTQQAKTLNMGKIRDIYPGFSQLLTLQIKRTDTHLNLHSFNNTLLA